jgi:sortase A
MASIRTSIDLTDSGMRPPSAGRPDPAQAPSAIEVIVADGLELLHLAEQLGGLIVDPAHRQLAAHQKPSLRPTAQQVAAVATVTARTTEVPVVVADPVATFAVPDVAATTMATPPVEVAGRLTALAAPSPRTRQRPAAVVHADNVPAAPTQPAPTQPAATHPDLTGTATTVAAPDHNPWRPSWFTVLGWVRNVAIVVAGFAVYQLYGTGVLQSREQSSLRSEFVKEQRLERANLVTPPALTDPTTSGLVDPSTSRGNADGALTELPGTDGSETDAPADAAPQAEAPAQPNDASPPAAATPTKPGAKQTPPTITKRISTPRGAVAIIRIPSIDVDQVVVSGTTNGDLAKGPGWIRTTSAPGMTGNVGIAGHRTTHGAPFSRLNELKPGDQIELSTLDVDVRYEVTGVQIVSPSAVNVLTNVGDDRLTLTTCHPKYSDNQRLVVSAKLVGASRTVTTGSGSALGDPASTGPGSSRTVNAPSSDLDSPKVVQTMAVQLPTSVGAMPMAQPKTSTLLVASYVLLAVGALMLVVHFGGKWRQRNPSLLVHFVSWIPAGTFGVVLYSALNGFMPPLA